MGLLSLEELQELARIRNARYSNATAPKLTASQRRDILLAYMAGETISALAKRFGVTPQTVSYHIRRHTAETKGL